MVVPWEHVGWAICRDWLGGLNKDLISKYVFLVISPELRCDLHLLDEAGDDHAQAGAAPALLVTEDAGHTGGDLLQNVCNVIRGQAGHYVWNVTRGLPPVTHLSSCQSRTQAAPCPRTREFSWPRDPDGPPPSCPDTDPADS